MKPFSSRSTATELQTGSTPKKSLRDAIYKAPSKKKWGGFLDPFLYFFHLFQLLPRVINGQPYTADRSPLDTHWMRQVRLLLLLL